MDNYNFELLIENVDGEETVTIGYYEDEMQVIYLLKELSRLGFLARIECVYYVTEEKENK